MLWYSPMSFAAAGGGASGGLWLRACVLELAAAAQVRGCDLVDLDGRTRWIQGGPLELAPDPRPQPPTTDSSSSS